MIPPRRARRASRGGRPHSGATKFLFIHQDFPGHYRHVVQHLASLPGHDVRFIAQANENVIPGVRKLAYPKDERGAINCHPYTLELDRAIQAGAAVAETCRILRDEGFRPDLVVGHSGWGETLFVKDVFADVPLLSSFGPYHRPLGADAAFDPEFHSIFNEPSRLRARNAITLMAFQAADWGHSATAWQRSRYPTEMRPRISVLHEGVDTDVARPDPGAIFTLPAGGRVLSRDDEIVTYVARNLEPSRGFHVFMRALPELLRRRPKAEVVIAGGDAVSYGAPAPPRSTFRETLLHELRGELDLSRLHFAGMLEHGAYLKLLQVSSAHVYLAYPLGVSRSFMEAMACGCLVVGSATAPVLEVLKHGRNGLAVDFFDRKGLVDTLAMALEHRAGTGKLRRAARVTVVARYDLKRVTLRRWLRLFDDLARGRRPRQSLFI